MILTKKHKLECMCERCSHKWVTRNDTLPTVCPKCKSPYWNKKKVQKKIDIKEVIWDG